MEQEYFLRYAAPGQVLYPSRSSDAATFEPPSESKENQTRPFTVAFAGTLSTVDYAKTLVAAADALREFDGELLVYGPLDDEQAAALGLARQNMKLMGLLPGKELVSHIRERADALLVPMSFCPAEETAMRLNFPSKLTEYTAAGLPLLIVGPKHSSAVQWSEAHPGVALSLTSRKHTELVTGLLQLATDRVFAHGLAKNASRVGALLFSPLAAQQTFHGGLLQATPAPVTR